MLEGSDHFSSLNQMFMRSQWEVSIDGAFTEKYEQIYQWYDLNPGNRWALDIE